MVLYQLLLLLRGSYWLAICLTVLASVALLCLEERRERKEPEAAGDDWSRSGLEKSGGGAESSGGGGGVGELARSGEERCDLGDEVGDGGDVFDESPERRGGLGVEGGRVLGTSEGADVERAGVGVEKKKMDDNAGEDEDENQGLLVQDDDKNRLVEDVGEHKQLVDDREEENKGSPEDPVDEKSLLVEDDHENKQSTEAENHDDDDWEGIERTELEKTFGAAVAYTGRKENEECLTNSVKMQLYGFHKVATQGPCAEPQPRIFQVSARANWNVWRQLGNMGREEAMKKYIALLSENAGNWMEDDDK